MGIGYEVQLPVKTSTGHLTHIASGGRGFTACGREWTQYVDDHVGVGCRRCNRALSRPNRERIEREQKREYERRLALGYKSAGVGRVGVVTL